jgi:hypothetical protein
MEKMKMASQIDTPEGREWLKSLLFEQEVSISFKKIDGTERKMKCTLAESQIPVEKLPKNAKKSQNDQVLPVFDIEKQEWRSFRWDSVTEIQFGLAK